MPTTNKRASKKTPYTWKRAHHVTYEPSLKNNHHIDTWVQSFLPLYCSKFRNLATWWWQLLQHKLCYILPKAYSFSWKLLVRLFKAVIIELSFIYFYRTLFFIIWFIASNLIEIDFHILARRAKGHVSFLQKERSTLMCMPKKS